MVVSIVGVAGICVWGPLSLFVSPVGAILGHVAKRRVKETGEAGDSMALTGIILGWIGLGVSIILLAAYIALFWWMSTLPDEFWYPDTYDQ